MSKYVCFLISLFFLAGCAATPAPKYIHTFDKTRLSDVFYAEGANAGDFNGDGVQDIVSGPFWYEGPDFMTPHTIYPPVAFDPQAYSDHFFPHAYDFNDDGREDIFLIGFPGKEASWFENPGHPDSLWTRHIVFETVDNESPAWTDLDGDGKAGNCLHQ